MPQRLRASIRWKNFNMPVSYRINAQERMRDARNVMTNQDRLDTRNGVQRFNGTALSSAEVRSVSFFKKDDGTRYYIAKAGTKLYSVSESGAHTELKTGLTSTTKHRSVTFNNRAIISIESDGLYSWDGSTFTQLGQRPPTAPAVSTSATSASLTAGDYQVAYSFYSSTLGYETNRGAASPTVTVAAGEQIDLSSLEITTENAYMDKKRVYIKDITNNSDWLFWGEITMAATTDIINADPTSTITPPETNAPPLPGGGKYLAVFGKKVAYSGSDNYKSDVFLSEEYLPDAFDDATNNRVVLKVSGQGPVTGIAVGFYNKDSMTPYLCMFKKGNIEAYSEINGQPHVSIVSSSVGAISHDTIKEIDGDIYFMSENGWHVISNGRLVKKKDKAFRLGEGDIDNIFTEDGYVYELNKQDRESFFSVHYPTLNQYLTFVSEGSNTAKNKAYNYEFSINGFRPYQFNLNFNDGCLAEDSNGEDMILLAGSSGRIYKHSINVSRHDQDESGVSVAIDAFAQLYWIAHEDLDATMNFGILDFRALSSNNEVTVKCFLDYELEGPINKTYDFSKAETGFILDVSKLDEGVLGDGRTIVRSTGGVYRTSQSLLVAFYQSAIDANMGLIQGQLDASKNGNSN